MAELDDKFLTYKSFKAYHDKLVREIADRTYTPQRIFKDQADLVSRDNWANKYGQVTYYGFRDGLIVTVGEDIWQLVNAKTFASIWTTINGSDYTKAKPEDIGWKIVCKGNVYDINGHTLTLYEK